MGSMLPYSSTMDPMGMYQSALEVAGKIWRQT